jgi:hypothetical protein
MTTEDTLQKARAELVKIRLEAAEVLAKGYERGRTEETAKRLVEIQRAIEAIDYAIAEGEEEDDAA